MKKIYIVAAFSLLAAGASAQNTRTGYFNDQYLYRYEMNPALGNEKNFVGWLPLGNINVSMQGTLHLTDVLYNIDGRTTTFLNPGVSAQEVLGNLGANNRVGFDVKIPIVSVGFKALGGYNNVGINVRASGDVRVPKALFSLLKEGVSNQTYDINNVGGRADAFAEIVLNHSRDLTSEWRVGGAMKFYVGAGAFNAKLDKAQLALGEDSWKITSEGSLAANIKNFMWKQNDKGLMDGAHYDSFGMNGFGIGFDLGAVYKPAGLPDWEFSLAFTDLGFISWSNNELASTNGVKQFESDRYTFNVDDDATNSFKNEWEIMKDDLEALYEFDVMGDTGAKVRGIGATMNAGVNYTLPAYRKLNFGLLNTTRINGPYSWTDFRLSANVAPVKCFSASAAFSAGTFGVGFGWLANVHVPGFSFFVGMDHTMGKLAKQGIPTNSNASFNIGFSSSF